MRAYRIRGKGIMLVLLNCIRKVSKYIPNKEIETYLPH